MAFSQTLWSLRIDNHSFEAVTNLEVDVIIKNREGNEVPRGHRLAQRDSIGKAMLDIFLPEFSKALDGLSAEYQAFVEKIKSGALSLTENPRRNSGDKSPVRQHESLS